jgi:hypothetical protein
MITQYTTKAPWAPIQKLKGQPKEVETQLAGEVAHDERHHEPDCEQYGCDVQVFPPIAAVLVSQFHAIDLHQQDPFGHVTNTAPVP